jgi:uncharacterized protein YlxW (UPF0749 family)
MKKVMSLMLALMLVFLVTPAAWGGEGEIIQKLEELRKEIKELQKKLEEKETQQAEIQQSIETMERVRKYERDEKTIWIFPFYFRKVEKGTLPVYGPYWTPPYYMNGRIPNCGHWEWDSIRGKYFWVDYMSCRYDP